MSPIVPGPYVPVPERVSCEARPGPAARRMPAAGPRLGRSLAALLLALLLALSVPSTGSVARAEAPIQFGPTQLQSLFPAGITFEGQATARSGVIVSARLAYRLDGDDVVYRVTLAPDRAAQAALRYHWDTRGEGVPPGARVVAWWEVTDSAGNRAASPESSLVYEDTRFLWRVRQNERVAIWYHDAPPEFGDLALEIANQALEYGHRLFQVDLPRPPRIILYNSQAEFTAWQPAVPGFAGGRAFPALGITAQAAPAGVAQREWLAAVIPHELARLYFHQAAYSPADAAPEWLGEGLAFYAEQVDHPAEGQALQVAVVRGALIPLAELAGDFGHDETRVRLGQAEAQSAVFYLMQAHGPERMVDLLRAYRNGLPSDQAFPAALGIRPEAFEEAWQMWLGVPKAWRPTPVPWPATARTAPIPAPSATPVATASPGPEAGLAPATAVPEKPAPPPAAPTHGSPAVWLAALAATLAVPGLLRVVKGRRPPGRPTRPGQSPGPR